MQYKRTYRSFLPGFMVLVFTSNSVFAEEKGLEQLQDITVEATRVEKSLYDIPASVGAVTKEDIQYGRQQLGIDEALNKVPGIFMQNRYNFNQDLSISVRGFGIADFGIRGIKVYVDGIPNTLPDGQSGIDNVDIGSIERMEVIRGPSSSLYGTASGGVLNIYTEDGPVAAPFIEGNAQYGSYDFVRGQVKAGGQKNNLNYLVSAQGLNYDGYREQSKVERYLFNSKFRYDFDNTSDLTFTANLLDKPIADDPGSLNAADYSEDRRQVFERNLDFDSGEEAEQQQFGLIYRKKFNEKHETIARNYYVFRNFDAKLPFGPQAFPGASGGQIALDRFFTGGGLQHIYTDTLFGRNNRLSVGFDVDSQMDERKNYDNNLGARGDLVFDQNEDVFNWGIYLQNEFDINDAVQLSIGLRYDEVEFDFEDNFLSDGDQSGTKTFDEISPAVGILWKATPGLNLYGTISTSFETPTTSEFATPDGSGGLNPGLDAQTATNYELGIKGLLPGRTSYQLSVFTIDVEDEITIVGENPSGNDFFENAGQSTRQGMEAALTFRPMQGLDVTLNYTYSDFRYDSFISSLGADFSGNKIPGHPDQFGYAEVAYYHPNGSYAVFDTQYVDEIPVDTANSAETKDYIVSNIRFGRSFYSGNTEIHPYIGINNLFDRKYVGNVRVNAPGSRFFEPAPELNAFAGLTVRFQ
jgi:iron complex outermembrane receptor protein